MRAVLLAVTALLAVSALPAKAQFAVICPTCASEFSALAGWGRQGADMIRQISEMQRQYQMLMSTYSAISHVTDVSSLTNALGGVTRQYVPQASDTLQFLGSASRMFGSGPSHMRADQLFSYQNAGTLRSAGAWFDRQASEMERREAVSANAKALSEAGMADAQGRIAELAAAQVRISAARDGTEVAAVQAALTASQMNIDIHKAQIDNMRLALEAENRVERQRGEQMQVMGAAQWGEQTQYAVDALNAGVD